MFIYSWLAVNSTLNTSAAEDLEDKRQLGYISLVREVFIYSCLAVTSRLIMGNSLAQGLIMIGLSVGPN